MNSCSPRAWPTASAGHTTVPLLSLMLLGLFAGPAAAEEPAAGCAQEVLTLEDGTVLVGAPVMRSEQVIVFRTCDGGTVSLEPDRVVSTERVQTVPAAAAPAASVPAATAPESQAAGPPPPPPTNVVEAPRVASPPEQTQSRRTPAWDRSGLGVSLGYGYQFAGLGGNLILYRRSGRATVAPYAGGGYFPSVSVGGASTGGGFGASGGLMVALGGRHRVVFDANIGLAAYVGESEIVCEYDYYAGEEVCETSSNHYAVYGATLGAGYELMTDGGFVVRPTVGLTFPFQDTLLGPVVPSLNLAFGLKR